MEAGMTREEAVKILKSGVIVATTCDMKEYTEAREMAIGNLENSIPLDRVKQAREEISKSCYKACITDDGDIKESKVLEILDKLIAESEGQ